MIKPVLPYLEIHLTDHCNLNCKACAHFSPLSTKSYLSLSEYKKDILRLKDLFNNISQLRLMGGEPLLNANWLDFIAVSRQVFPDSGISLVTNGLLIPTLSKSELENIKKFDAELQITAYNKSTQDISNYVKILNEIGVSYSVTDTSVFYKHISLSASRDPNSSIEYCRQFNYCPSLKHGKLYQCSGLANLEIFINYFDIKQIRVPEGLDIYMYKLTGNDVIAFLEAPDETCGHCFYCSSGHAWDTSHLDIDEWII